MCAADTPPRQNLRHLTVQHLKSEARRELARMPSLRATPARWENNRRYIRGVLARAASILRTMPRAERI